MIQMAQINVTRSSMPDFEEYINEIRELWDTHHLTNNGAKHRELQSVLEEYLSVPHVTLFTNGHIALEYAFEALDLPKGGEIITTPFTFASTTHAIVRAGYTPVFCDIRTDDYTMDPSKIEALITDRTCAIMPVHVYGNICDTDAIDRVAEKYGIKVIYDAAHAFGVKVNGVSAAAFGDVSMFSFHATKAFNTVEGGALCYRDDSLTSILDNMKNFGLSGEDCFYAGGNGKMSELHAAMGICNMRHLSDEIAKRKTTAEEYYRILGDVQGIKLCPPNEEIQSNYAYMPVFFDGYKYTRDEVQARLAEQGIMARKYFYTLTNDLSCYNAMPFFGADFTPVAKRIADGVLTLPLYADLTVDDVRMICDIIIK